MADAEISAAVAQAYRGPGRPTEYRLKDGTRVKGVTTIISRFKDSGPLLFWAFGQGKSGAAATLYEKRDEAGAVGSVCHDIIQCRAHGMEPPEIPPAMLERVTSAMSAYDEWFAANRMTIVATEIPLVSELHRYGGTIDAIARDAKGRLCLLDWKTSTGIYPDYALQLAAYRQLWNENNPSEPITDGGYHLCRFAKEYGDFEHRYWPELNEAWELFKLYLLAYDLDAQLKKRIR